jgi:hypothetical protein
MIKFILLGIYLGIGLVISLIFITLQILGGKANLIEIIVGTLLSIPFWPILLMITFKKK